MYLFVYLCMYVFIYLFITKMKRSFRSFLRPKRTPTFGMQIVLFLFDKYHLSFSGRYPAVRTDSLVGGPR
jgi:hypothetical protein